MATVRLAGTAQPSALPEVAVASEVTAAEPIHSTDPVAAVAAQEAMGEMAEVRRTDKLVQVAAAGAQSSTAQTAVPTSGAWAVLTAVAAAAIRTSTGTMPRVPAEGEEDARMMLQVFSTAERAAMAERVALGIAGVAMVVS